MLDLHNIMHTLLITPHAQLPSDETFDLLERRLLQELALLEHECAICGPACPVAKGPILALVVRHQLCVVTTLDHNPPVHYHDLVCARDRGQPVCYHEDSAA